MSHKYPLRQFRSFESITEQAFQTFLYFNDSICLLIIFIVRFYHSFMKKSYIFAPKPQVKRSTTVSKSNLIQKPTQIMPQTYKYYVGVGNNSHLIRKIMSTRKNWEEVTDSKQINISFKWQQTNRGYNYDLSSSKKGFKQVLNHFQYHQEISNKEYLFKNVLQYCELLKINAFQFLPLTFILNTLDSSFESQQTHFLNFYYQNGGYSPPNAKQKTSLQIRKKPITNSSIFLEKKSNPVTSKYQIKQAYTSPNSKCLWILKPTFYNRGNGIHVFNNLGQLQNLMSKYINGSMEQLGVVQFTQIPAKSLFGKEIHSSSLMIQSTSFVIQKYMERPLLCGGRKFDIRVWVLYTHQLKIFLFRQGYIRTSSFNFSVNEDKIMDLSVHLTNNAVQKYNPDYNKYEKGNQLSFKTLRKMIQEKGKDYETFIIRMKDIIKYTANSVKRRINRMERDYCFEIFGYDFMVDEIECKPWLIEVNTNPCIEQSSPLLQQLLPRMIDDAFNLTLDKIFPTSKSVYSYVVQNESNTQNLWDPIVDLKKV